MKDLILCDASWMLYRNFYTFRSFTIETGTKIIPTGHIYGFIRDVLLLRDNYGPDVDIILCLDGIPKRRIELMGGSVKMDELGRVLSIDRGQYKSGRKKLEYNIFNDLENILIVLSYCPFVKFCSDYYLESDDIMFSLSRTNMDLYDRIFIFSGDNDLLQAINHKVFVIRSSARDGVILDESWVLTKSGFDVSPSQLPIYRALRGDKSDTISSVYPRLPKGFAREVARLINQPQDLTVSMIPLESSYISSYRRLLDNSENMNLFKRNFELMKLGVRDDLELCSYCTPAGVAREILDFYSIKAFNSMFAPVFRVEYK